MVLFQDLPQVDYLHPHWHLHQLDPHLLVVLVHLISEGARSTTHVGQGGREGEHVACSVEVRDALDHAGGSEDQ